MHKDLEKGTYALITGASQGLGKALATELASQKINLLLVALANEGLPEFCESLKKDFKIKAEYHETDFCENGAVKKLVKWAEAYPVSILVNNAGLGGTRAFHEASTEYIDRIIQVNVRTTTILTRLMLNELRQHKESYILNVSSMASFSPLPFKTVYPASKAFITYFSKGLQTELRGSNVHVSVIHPGPIPTNVDVTARIDQMGPLGRIGLFTPEAMAFLAVKNMFRRRFRVIPGFMNKLNWLLLSVLPDILKLPLLYRIMQKDLASINPIASVPAKIDIG